MDDKFLKLSIETDTFMDRKYPLWRDSPLYENVWQQKFAELIVAECARIAEQSPCQIEDEESRKIFGHTWDMACLEAGKDIRKHFGLN